MHPFNAVRCTNEVYEREKIYEMDFTKERDLDSNLEPRENLKKKKKKKKNVTNCFLLKILLPVKVIL